jgi:hypothetical protein
MPKVSNNQKVMSSNEKEKMAEGSKKRKLKDEDDGITVRNAKVKIFEKEKENLPTLLKQRTTDLVIAIEKELEGYAGLKAARIHQLISSKSSFANAYSATELIILKDAYADMVAKINEKTFYMPSKGGFCSFIGISVATFNNYKTSSDNEKRDAANQIDDYINTMMLDAGKMNKTNPYVTVYEMKAIQGVAEQTNPQVITIGNTTTPEQAQQLIDRILKANVINAEFHEKENK